MPNSSIHSNERELSSKISEWLNNILKSNNFPFKESSVETSIISGTKTLFGDIVIWKNIQSREAYSLIELKKPYGVKENLDTFRKKADKLRVNYAFTWNFQSLNVYTKKDNFKTPVGTENINILNSVNDWTKGDIQARIKSYMAKICDELFSLEETGHIKAFIPERYYFVNLIRETVNKLIPSFEQFIRDSSRKNKNKDLINAYVAKQGIAYSNDEDYFKLIASQRVYSLVIKIIFYLTVKRYFKELPELDDTKESDLSKILKMAFQKASEKDWQAVFIDDPIDELGIPEASYGILINFFSDLKVYHFGELPEDVISEIYTEIIDPEHRHNLGQYFTNEDLVDFILGATVNDKDGFYCDPTSGSGTFLIRLYDRLKFLSSYNYQHNELLNKIWGIDIAKFPSELSTINLFRQDVKNFDNFPRIINNSIFNILKGSTHEFPPPNARANFKKVKVELPEFTSIVGNFPFIRQELIEKKVKGFKNELTKILAQEYLFVYPELFDLMKIEVKHLTELKNYPNDKKNRTINEWIDSKKIEINLSGKADIYAYIFLHTATLLSENGMFGIITSNSWLDVSYGSVLKEFILKHFKIKMVIASWAEPWFEDAAVNTVITILERANNEKARNDNNVKFVKLKKKFSELIPYRDLKLEYNNRWNKIDSLIRTIETSEYQSNCKEIGIIPLKSKKENVDDRLKSYEDDNFRIRLVNQSALKNEIDDNKELSKWSKFLRAPDVYFEILEKCKDKLIPLKHIADVRFGIKTGINEYFYLEKIGETENTIICINRKGWEGEIEKKFLLGIIKSPRESENIKVKSEDLKFLIFVCNKSKEELRKENFHFALKFIEWGENQTNSDNIKYPLIKSVRDRKHWWSIEINELSNAMWPKAFNDKFIIYKKDKFLVSDRFYEISFNSPKNISKKIAILNSTIQNLFIEINGRINLGEGALDNMTYESEDCFIVNPDLIQPFDKSIEQFFKRKSLSIFKEVKEKDRIKLDTEILKSLGLNPKEYLSKIYDGLCEMVKERLELPKMRRTKQKQTIKVSFQQVKESVISDILPDGIKKFPDAFYIFDYGKSNKKFKDLNSDLSQIECEVIPTTGKMLSYSFFMGHCTLNDVDGQKICTFDSELKAKYAVLSSKPDVYQILIPKDERVLDIIITNYENYIDELREQLYSNAIQKLFDQSQAERMTEEILNEKFIVINNH